MNIVFAPDWRNGNNYQTLLAAALQDQRIEVSFLSDYRRGLPLWRGLRSRNCDLLHLHWPEAYFSGLTPLQKLVRSLKFIPDLYLATRRLPLVLTGHNVFAHDRHNEFLAKINSRNAYTRACAVIAHSSAAKTKLVDQLGLTSEKCYVIPHGDPSVLLGAPVDAAKAKRTLELPNGRICLMFGNLKRYKGIEEVIEFWATYRPSAMLAIVGVAESKEYERRLANMTDRVSGVLTRFKRLEDRELALWLSAADCAIFNHDAILTSGAACLARSWGLPILIPSRLDTVDLGEPNPFVRRFSNLRREFASQLESTLATRPDYGMASTWREETAWAKIATATADVYAFAMRKSNRAGRHEKD